MSKEGMKQQDARSLSSEALEALRGRAVHAAIQQGASCAVMQEIFRKLSENPQARVMDDRLAARVRSVHLHKKVCLGTSSSRGTEKG
jgi:hypothetical protein